MSLTARRNVTDEDASDELVPRGQPVPGTDMPHVFKEPAPIPAKLIRAHALAGLWLLLVAALFGLVTAWKFHDPEFMGQQEWSTWGRTRANHVQGILLAWLVNGFMAFAYFAVPTLTNRPILSERLGWAIFWFWNVGVVLGGWVLVSIGLMQSVEWGEFPAVIDVFIIIGLLAFAVQLCTPYIRQRRESKSSLYVASWYLLLALTFTPVAFIIGQFLPPFVTPGATGAVLSGLWIHDAVGMFTTPLALLIAYYVIPAATGRPIFSHFMSLIGFWGLVYFYPLNGIHHYTFSPIPMHAQTSAIAASVAMGLTVVIVVVNLYASLRGSARMVVTYLPLRFVWMALFFYILVSLQGAYQAGMPVQEVIHFTDWVIAHSHMAMAGFATFMVFGGILHFWPMVSGRMPDPALARSSFWVSTLALSAMIIDLTIVGLQQASMWLSGNPWIDSVTASMPGWITRSVSGTALFIGFILFIAALHKAKPVEEIEVADKAVDVAAAKEAVQHG